MLERWMERRFGSDVTNESVRSRYGKAASVAGVGANAMLFLGKLIAGMACGSVSITADAVNNLSDASASIISLLGFKLAGKPADEHHPYGHGRMEYLAGLMVAVMILVIGVEMMKSSVDRILHPAPVQMSAPMVAVLVGSIAVKCWMAAFNRRIGKKIDSQTLMATADDSRNDVMATGAVLLSTVISSLTGWMLDGWMGALVALFILISGVGLVRDTMDPVLGKAPTWEFVAAIRRKLESYPGVLGVHDLLVHDYGPGRQYASVHLEMDAKVDALRSHALIDGIERDILSEMGLHLVIHCDPVETGDAQLGAMRERVAAIAKDIYPQMTIHDLRIVPGQARSNIAFDCVAPYDCGLCEAEIRQRLAAGVGAAYPEYGCLITLENGTAEHA